MKRHIIADLHGQLDRLYAILEALGYDTETMTHPEGWKPVFTGDYIDRGPDGLGVLRAVHRMFLEGKCEQPILGNHEINAMLYHADGPDGEGLRKRNTQNTHQHQAFLDQCPLGSPEAAEAISIMFDFRLATDFGPFRAVHAYWDEALISAFMALRPDGRFLREDVSAMALEDEGGVIGRAAKLMTKGPEMRLAEGFYFDSQGSKRKKSRINWWSPGQDLHGVLASISDYANIPNGEVPEDAKGFLYPNTEKPVFFGHYQLDGPGIGLNAVCLDAPGRPLAWAWDGEFSPEQLRDPFAPETEEAEISLVFP